MGADSPEIVIGAVENALYVNMMGRATQRTCPTAEHVISDFLSSNPQSAIVVLDMTACDWIDSTFAGWLVGLSKRIGRMSGGQLQLSGASDRCRDSLEKMGLASIFQFAEHDAPEDTQNVRCTTSDQPTKAELRLMLEAHETLAAVSSENERIFSPIVATLRAQIERC